MAPRPATSTRTSRADHRCDRDHGEDQENRTGRYGPQSVARIPKIANGSWLGQSRSTLKIGKTYTYKGKKVSVLSARCADGKLQAFASAIFGDGTKASAGIIRTCRSKG